MRKRLRFTKREAIKLHRELWRWLAENPSGEKEDWFYLKKNLDKYSDVRANCFLCHYAIEKTDTSVGSLACVACPLIWKISRRCETNSAGRNSYYEMWQDNYSTSKQRAKLALKIANLKERKFKR